MIQKRAWIGCASLALIRAWAPLSELDFFALLTVSFGLRTMGTYTGRSLARREENPWMLRV